VSIPATYTEVKIPGGSFASSAIGLKKVVAPI